MADKQIIAATISVDTGNANEEVKELNKNVNALDNSLEDTSKSAATTGKTIDGTTGNFGKLKDQMGALPGPLGAATKGVEGVGSAFKALLANPIVLLIAAIVAALAALYKAFTSTNDGADKMEQIFAGLGAAIDVIRDRVLKVAGAIAKFFSGDFKGALADGRAAVSGIGEEISREFQAAANATRIIQELDDELRNLSVSRAKLNADLAEAKERINDADISSAVRRENIAKVREAEAKQNEAEIAEAEARYKAIVAKNELSDKSDEDLQAEADALIKIQNLRAQSAAQNRQLDKLEKQIQREDAAKAQEAYRQQQERIKATETERKNQIEKEKADSIAKLNARLQYAESLTALEQKEAEDRKKIEEDFTAKMDAEFQKQVAIENQAYQNAKKTTEAKAELDRLEQESKQRLTSGIANSLYTLADIAGKQTVLGKGLAIAATTINTFQSAIAAFRGVVQTIPGPVGIAIGAVAAAGAVAAGLAAVKKIVAVKVPGASGGGGGSVPSGIQTPAAPVAPTTQTTSLDQASLNNIGNAATGAKVYVLDSDVTNNQERNTRLNRAARLGG
jgi:chemotaxis protein histidine kinase CheA